MSCFLLRRASPFLHTHTQTKNGIRKRTSLFLALFSTAKLYCAFEISVIENDSTSDAFSHEQGRAERTRLKGIPAAAAAAAAILIGCVVCKESAPSSASGGVQSRFRCGITWSTSPGNGGSGCEGKAVKLDRYTLLLDLAFLFIEALLKLAAQWGGKGR